MIDLPTIPTWGIVRGDQGRAGAFLTFAKWHWDGIRFRGLGFDSNVSYNVRIYEIAAFIPLTQWQVAQVEADE